jgi:hypothetical protein
MTAAAILDWLQKVGVKTLYIEPGTLWERDPTQWRSMGGWVTSC